MSETACAHGRLAFDGGGALVVCLDCPDAWALVPRDDHDRQAPIGLGRSDIRVRPAGSSRGNLDAEPGSRR